MLRSGLFSELRGRPGFTHERLELLQKKKPLSSAASVLHSRLPIRLVQAQNFTNLTSVRYPLFGNSR